jgi:hypothetical protein
MGMVDKEKTVEIYYSPCHAYPMKVGNKILETKRHWEEITGVKLQVLEVDHSLLFTSKPEEKTKDENSQPMRSCI